MLIGFGDLVAAAGVGAGFFGGKSSEQALQEGTDKSIANQVAATNFSAQLKTNAQSLQAAMGLLPMQFGELVAAPRELERQKEAEKFKYGDLRGIQRAGESEDWRRAMDRATSGPAKEAARFASKLQGQQQSFANRAVMRGMFGPVAEDMFFGA